MKGLRRSAFIITIFFLGVWFGNSSSIARLGNHNITSVKHVVVFQV